MGGVCQSKSKVKKAEAAKKTYQLDVLTDHEGGINTMAISDDGAILATGSDDHTDQSADQMTSQPTSQLTR